MDVFVHKPVIERLLPYLPIVDVLCLMKLSKSLRAAILAVTSPIKLLSERLLRLINKRLRPGLIDWIVSSLRSGNAYLTGGLLVDLLCGLEVKLHIDMDIFFAAMDPNPPSGLEYANDTYDHMMPHKGGVTARAIRRVLKNNDGGGLMSIDHVQFFSNSAVIAATQRFDMPICANLFNFNFLRIGALDQLRQMKSTMDASYIFRGISVIKPTPGRPTPLDSFGNRAAERFVKYYRRGFDITICCPPDSLQTQFRGVVAGRIRQLLAPQDIECNFVSKKMKTEMV
jgi:hypothetical protein